MPEINKIKKLTDNVEGWLRDAEAKLLYKLAQNIPQNGVIVEIGSWQGKSTIWLGKGAEKVNAKVYAIDPHTGDSSEIIEQYGGHIDTFDSFLRNIKKSSLENTVYPIKKHSYHALGDVKEEIDLLFIDGAHEYEAVKKDYEMWFPKLKEGGIIAFHDTVGKFSGPRIFVQKHIFGSRKFKKVRFTDSITYAIKVKCNNKMDTIINKLNSYVHIIFHYFVQLYLKLT